MKKPPADLVALIDAVKESPDDDGPRLVLADWLDEHGDDEGRAHAELIRAQCALLHGLAAAVCPDDPAPLHALLRRDAHHGAGLKFHFNRLFLAEPRLAELLRRDSELIKQWSARWLAPLGEDPWCQWHRGTATLRCTEPFRSRPLNELSKGLTGHLIEGLEIETVPSRVAAVARCRLMEQPVGLDVRGAGLTMDDVLALLGSPRLRGLRRVALPGRREPRANVRALTRAPGLERLSHLALARNQLTEEDARALADCPALGRLTLLNLTGNRDLGRNGAAALAPAPFLGGLAELILSDCFLTADAIRELFARPQFRCPQLLGLGTNALRERAAEVLLAAPGLERVLALDLTANDLTDGAVAQLANSPRLAGLLSLKLGSNHALGRPAPRRWRRRRTSAGWSPWTWSRPARGTRG